MEGDGIFSSVVENISALNGGAAGKANEESSALCQRIFSTISMLGNSSTEVSIKFCSLGACEAIIRALETHRKDPDVVSHGCLTISALSKDDKFCKSKFCENGVCRILNDLLRVFKRKSSVLELIVSTILCLCSDSPLICSRFVFAGLEDVIRSMEKKSRGRSTDHPSDQRRSELLAYLRDRVTSSSSGVDGDGHYGDIGDRSIARPPRRLVAPPPTIIRGSLSSVETASSLNNRSGASAAALSSLSVPVVADLMSAADVKEKIDSQLVEVVSSSDIGGFAKTDTRDTPPDQDSSSFSLTSSSTDKECEEEEDVEEVEIVIAAGGGSSMPPSPAVEAAIAPALTIANKPPVKSNSSRSSPQVLVNNKRLPKPSKSSRKSSGSSSKSNSSSNSNSNSNEDLAEDNTAAAALPPSASYLLFEQPSRAKSSGHGPSVRFASTIATELLTPASATKPRSAPKKRFSKTDSIKSFFTSSTGLSNARNQHALFDSLGTVEETAEAIEEALENKDDLDNIEWVLDNIPIVVGDSLVSRRRMVSNSTVMKNMMDLIEYCIDIPDAAPICRKSCLAIRHLSKGNADMAVKLGQLKACEIVSRLLEKHKDNVLVSEAACAAITHLAVTEANRLKLINAGVLRVLASVLKSRKSDIKSFSAVCKAIVTILQPCRSSRSSSSATISGDEDTVGSNSISELARSEAVASAAKEEVTVFLTMLDRDESAFTEIRKLARMTLQRLSPASSSSSMVGFTSCSGGVCTIC